MNLSLADRIEFDTIERLVAASRGRFAEAEWLRGGGFSMAAIYFYGYSAEMVLGAMLARILLGKSDGDEISPADRESILGLARGRGRMDRSHPIDGLALQLIAERRNQRTRNGLKRTKAEAEIEQILGEHALSFRANWRPRLRYQALTPSVDEVESVREAASWLLSYVDQL